MDRPSQAKNPLLQTLSYTYDLNSNLQTRTDRLGQRWEYTYGTGDQLTGLNFRKTDGTLESSLGFSYDPTTHLLSSCTDSLTGTCSWTYDSLDRATALATPNGTLSYTMDDLDRRTGLQVPGQALVSYWYDATDNVTSIVQGGLTSSFVYDVLGRMSQQSLPNGVSSSWSFDNAGFLTSLISRLSGAAFDSHTYTRDNVGNITQANDNGALCNYGYDDLYRLISASDPTGTSSWTYDNVGNRLTQILNGVSTGYSYDGANRLTAVAGVPVSFDANGNTTAYGSDLYTWDVRGRMSQMTRPGNAWLYSYAWSDQRVGQTVNGTTTNLLFDGPNCVSEIGAASTVQSLFGAVSGQPLTRNGQYFTTNQQGSTTTLTNGTGSVVQQYSYSPFGTSTPTPNPGSSNPFQYVSGTNDNNGLQYVNSRYSVPQWGRSLGGSSGVSPPTFAGNNPVNLVAGFSALADEPSKCTDPGTEPHGDPDQAHQYVETEVGARDGGGGGNVNIFELLGGPAKAIGGAVISRNYGSPALLVNRVPQKAAERKLCKRGTDPPSLAEGLHLVAACRPSRRPSASRTTAVTKSAGEPEFREVTRTSSASSRCHRLSRLVGGRHSLLSVRVVTTPLGCRRGSTVSTRASRTRTRHGDACGAQTRIWCGSSMC